jgi:hypothetical protein
MMMDVKISVAGVSDGPRYFAPKSKMVTSSRCWSSIISCDPVASKDPCWSSFRLSGGRGGSSVTGDRPRSLCDQKSS